MQDISGDIVDINIQGIKIITVVIQSAGIAGGQEILMSEGQIIISIGRQFGSGGHEIAAELAKRLGIELYDRKLVEGIAEQYGHDFEDKYDEKKRNVFMSRSLNGMNNSIEENIAQGQFKFIKDRADSGESFVVVGRCSDYILRDNPNLITCFITGDKEKKIERVMSIYSIDRDTAFEKMKRHDRKRGGYHDYYCQTRWAAVGSYDIMLNSSRFGIVGCVGLLQSALNSRILK